MDVLSRIINKLYKNKRAYLKIRAIIPNPQTHERTPLFFEGIVDTGFDGGLFVPETFKSDLDIVNVTPRKTSLILADGRKIPVETCFIYLQEIDGIRLPAPGIAVQLVLGGKLKGHLIGMDLLKHCITEFNGPSQTLNLKICCVP